MASPWCSITGHTGKRSAVVHYAHTQWRLAVHCIQFHTTACERFQVVCVCVCVCERERERERERESCDRYSEWGKMTVQLISSKTRTVINRSLSVMSATSQPTDCMSTAQKLEEVMEYKCVQPYRSNQSCMDYF